MNETEKRRWISLGEIIAVAALIVSAVGVWIAWKASNGNQPTRVVEQRQAIPLSLRGRREDDGTRLEITPVEASHSLESLKVALPGATAISIGSDGELRASDVESVLSSHAAEAKNRTYAIRIRIDARYVEAGKDRQASGIYTLSYMWKSGGLFSGRSLHLVGLSR